MTRLAARVRTVHVVAQDAGPHRACGGDVRVRSLGRERGAGRLARVLRLQGVLREILLRERSADVVLCHMCPEYAVAAYPAARAARVPLFLWYTHGSASMWLRLASLLSDGILTASIEGFPLRGDHVIPIGHGIDLEKFRPSPLPRNGATRSLLSVGRLSPVKAHEVPIEALASLVRERGIENVELRIIGAAPLPSQRGYAESLRALVGRLGLERHVRFLGAVPYGEIDRHLGECEVFVSASRTGSLDKAPLEAMACGRVVLTSNDALRSELGGREELLAFRRDDAADLAEKLARVLGLDRERLEAVGNELARGVRERHDLGRLVGRALEVFERAV